MRGLWWFFEGVWRELRMVMDFLDKGSVLWDRESVAVVGNLRAVQKRAIRQIMSGVWFLWIVRMSVR